MFVSRKKQQQKADAKQMGKTVSAGGLEAGDDVEVATSKTALCFGTEQGGGRMMCCEDEVQVQLQV